MIGEQNEAANQKLASTPLTLFVEPYCEEHVIPPEGEAIVFLDDGEPHSLDFHSENWVTLWNEGSNEAVVAIVSKEQNAVIDALHFAGGWLSQYGQQGRAAAQGLNEAIALEEQRDGYLPAHFAAYRAFRKGFQTKSLEAAPASVALPEWRGSKALAKAYDAGGVGAYFNYLTRLDPSLVELGSAPFDTETARGKFRDADAVIE